VLFFWAYLRGIAGRFIVIPIVNAALMLYEHHPSSQAMAEICGDPVASRDQAGDDHDVDPGSA